MASNDELKKILATGSVALGTAVFSHSPAIVEVAGYSGLDFVRIDNEHAWRRDESMEHLMRAAAIAHVTPIVRGDKGDPNLIRKALEIGARGIIVPDIKTRAEAEAVIQASKFPPRGIRGYSSLCFSGRWGFDAGQNWVDSCDHDNLVGIMIETEEMIAHLDEVLSLEGLDFVLFGPADFSMSLGLRKPQKSHPKVQDALKKTVEVAQKYHKSVAIGIGKPWEEEAQKYIELGCRMIELGNDVSAVRFVWETAAKALKQ
jgi:4-hydroxy-2-oxoheptanedioate aldolase